MGSDAFAPSSDYRPAMDNDTMSNYRPKARLEASPIHLLHRAGQCASELFTEELGEDGLTPRQYAVLVSVAASEGLSQTDLVTRTGIDRSTLADVVRRMLKKGLLLRKRTRQDARTYAVRLSDRGWMALKSAEPSAIEADRRLLEGLNASQRDAFIEAMDLIVRSFADDKVRG